MSLTSKLASDRNQKALLELCMKPGNDICADCKSRNPRWTSWNLGIFLCVTCASIHRKIGTHITKVKSVTMDTWTNDQVETMKNMGNIKSNAIFNPNELRNPPPADIDDSSRDSELERYIRAKYEYRKYLDTTAFVASKMGPSRSASSLVPRSTSNPVHRASTLGPSASPSPAAARSPLPASTSQPSTIPEARPASHFLVAQQQTQPQAPQGAVWDDLVQLQDSSPSPSLALQYQPTSSPSLVGLPQTSFVNPGLSIGATPTGLGLNQFQQSPALYPQQQALPALNTSQFTPSAQLTPNFQQQPIYGQQLFMHQQTLMSPVFHPRPQTAGLQPQQQQASFLSASPSMMSAPVTQTQFLTPSPSQQMTSHSPGAFTMTSAPQPQMGYMTPSAQPQMSYMTPSPQPQMGYMPSHSPAQMQMTTGMPMQSQFGAVPPMQQQDASLQAFSQSMMPPALFQAGMMNGAGQGGFNSSPYGQQQWSAF